VAAWFATENWLLSGKHVVIVGASGIVGSALLRQFNHTDARVLALCRRRPFDLGAAQHISLDLLDENACGAAAIAAVGATHLIYTALYEKSGNVTSGWTESDQIETNVRMLKNILQPFAGAPSLRHVSVVHGTKAYGGHVEPFAVPAREDRSERRDVPNFYWGQENELIRQRSGRAWRWTTFRPVHIFGRAVGGALNPIAALGVYAAILRERGQPLHFPGGPDRIQQAIDADLLARCIDWAGDAAQAHGQAFNVENGDVFTWHNVWPAIARAFGMEPGEHRACSLTSEMPKLKSEWNAIRAKYDLVSPEMGAFVSSSFQTADYELRLGRPEHDPAHIVSGIKLRQAGFTEVMDTEAMFASVIKSYQQARLLPAAS
jgi:nucleoside-diphosphate-sugar epimerase